MKFKILELEQKGNNLHVAISHSDCVRQVYSLPISMYKNDKYIDEIKRILKERESKKISISKKQIGKTFEVN